MPTPDLPRPLAEMHRWARAQPWLGRFTLANRLLLAMAFIPTGLVKATNQRFTLLPVSDPVGFFFEAMYQTGPYWIFVGCCQVVAGVLLLFPATATLGALLFLPIIGSIVLITWGIGFGNTAYVTSLMLLSVIYLLAWDADRVHAAARSVLGASGGPPLLAGANRLERAGWLTGGAVGMALLLSTRGLVPVGLRLELLFLGAAAAVMVASGWVVGLVRSRGG